MWTHGCGSGWCGWWWETCPTRTTPGCSSTGSATPSFAASVAERRPASARLPLHCPRAASSVSSMSSGSCGGPVRVRDSVCAGRVPARRRGACWTGVRPGRQGAPARAAERRGGGGRRGAGAGPGAGERRGRDPRPPRGRIASAQRVTPPLPSSPKVPPHLAVAPRLDAAQADKRWHASQTPPPPPEPPPPPPTPASVRGSALRPLS